jgi:heme ABC exporter ATP-binding subunit CcmA
MADKDGEADVRAGLTADFDHVALVDISRQFGRRRVLTRANISIRSGEIVGLLGPNGAGKSTLIDILALLVSPSSGEVRYGNQQRSASGPGLRRQIGLLGHELYLYPELTARQNLSFFAALYGIPPEPAVTKALASAGLADRGDEEVSGFSRGMRQRLALERTLLHGPRLVLLDEPFTGLDDRAVTIVTDRLRAIAGEGAIVLLATHDLDLAEGLVSRVVMIREGRIAADEPAAGGLRARYRALFGARSSA